MACRSRKVTMLSILLCGLCLLWFAPSEKATSRTQPFCSRRRRPDKGSTAWAGKAFQATFRAEGGDRHKAQKSYDRVMCMPNEDRRREYEQLLRKLPPPPTTTTRCPTRSRTWVGEFSDVSPRVVYGTFVTCEQIGRIKFQLLTWAQHLYSRLYVVSDCAQAASSTTSIDDGSAQ